MKKSMKRFTIIFVAVAVAIASIGTVVSMALTNDYAQTLKSEMTAFEQKVGNGTLWTANSVQNAYNAYVEANKLYDRFYYGDDTSVAGQLQSAADNLRNATAALTAWGGPPAVTNVHMNAGDKVWSSDYDPWGYTSKFYKNILWSDKNFDNSVRATYYNESKATGPIEIKLVYPLYAVLIDGTNTPQFPVMIYAHGTKTSENNGQRETRRLAAAYLVNPASDALSLAGNWTNNSGTNFDSSWNLDTGGAGPSFTYPSLSSGYSQITIRSSTWTGSFNDSPKYTANIMKVGSLDNNTFFKPVYPHLNAYITAATRTGNLISNSDSEISPFTVDLGAGECAVYLINYVPLKNAMTDLFTKMASGNYKEGGLLSAVSNLTAAQNFNYNSYFTNEDWQSVEGNSRNCAAEIERLTGLLKVETQDRYKDLRSSIEDNRSEFYKYSYKWDESTDYYEPIYCDDLWEAYDNAVLEARNAIIAGATNNYNDSARASKDATDLNTAHSNLSLGHVGELQDNYANITKKATCTENGTRELYYECSRCTAQLTYEYYYDNAGSSFHSDKWAPEVKDIEAAGHHFVVNTEAKAATCTADGTIASWICGNQTADSSANYYYIFAEYDFSDCNGKIYADANGSEEIKDGLAIEKLGHEAGKTETVITENASCIKAGSQTTTVYCVRYDDCNYKISETTETIAKKDHEWDDFNDEIKPATCTEDGTRVYYHCENCGYYFGEDDVKADEASAPGKDKSVTIIKAEGHDFTKDGFLQLGFSATCLNPGEVEHWHCMTETTDEMIGCGPDKDYELNSDPQTAEPFDSTIEALGHDLVAGETGDPTCLKTGTKEHYYCQRENCELKDRDDRYFATNDDESKKAEEGVALSTFDIEAHGHSFSEKITGTPATCTETGEKDHYICTNKDCDLGKDAKFLGNDDENYKFKGEGDDTTEPATGHQNINPVEAVPATCTKNGTKAHYKCDDCETLFTDEDGDYETTLDALVDKAPGHQWEKEDGEGAVAPADCITDGNLQYWYCTVCQKYYADGDSFEAELLGEGTEADTVDHAKGHNLVAAGPIEATCVEGGIDKYYYCTNDNCPLKNAADDAKYFAEDNEENRKATEGVTLDSLRGAVNPDNHPEGELKEHAETAETCDMDGNMAYYHCEACGHYYDGADGKVGEDLGTTLPEEYVIPAAHILAPVKEGQAATCTADGWNTYYKCTREGGCGNYYKDADAQNAYAQYNYAENLDCVVIPAMGHLFTDEDKHDTEIPATCNAPGTKAHWHCSRENGCGLDYEPEADEFEDTENAIDITLPIVPTAHPAESIKKTPQVDPSCNKDGMEAYWTCETCGNIYEEADTKGETPLDKDTFEEELKIEKCHLFNTDPTSNGQDPTCTEAGWQKYWQCRREGEDSCGGLFYTSDNAYQESSAGHKDVTEDGIKIDAKGHQFGEATTAIEATCRVQGTKAYFECSVCHIKFDSENYNKDNVQFTNDGGVFDTEEGQLDESLRTPVDSKNHVDENGKSTITKHEYKEESCTVKGNNTYYECSKCGGCYEDEKGAGDEKSATDFDRDPSHKFGEPEEDLPASCLNPGHAQYWVCQRTNDDACGKRIYTDGDPKNTEQKSTTLEALQAARPKLGHQFSEEAVPQIDPTCLADGTNAYYTCERENCDIKEQDPKFLGNNDEYKFADRGATEEELSIVHTENDHPKDKLKYTSQVDENCTEDGKKAYWYCELCENTYTGESNQTPGTKIDADKVDDELNIPAAHVFDDEHKNDGQAPTCLEDGWKPYWICQREGDGSCGGKYYLTKGATAAASGTGYDDVQQEGIKINAKGHDFGDYVPAKEAFCNAEGNHGYYTCQVETCSISVICDENEKEAKKYYDGNDTEKLTIPKDPYNHAEKLTQHSAQGETCTADGWNAYWSCEVCGKFFTTADMGDDEARPTIYNSEVAVKAAAEIKIPAAHVFGDDAVIAEKAATCLEPGNDTYYKCTRTGEGACGKYYTEPETNPEKAESLETSEEEQHKAHKALGHDFKDETKAYHAIDPASCLLEGTKEYWECQRGENGCGNKKYTSTDATEEITDTAIPALKHSFTDESKHAKVDATCIKTGMEAYWRCVTDDGCGLSYPVDSNEDTPLDDAITPKTLEKDFNNHTKLHLVAKLDETCFNDGKQAHWYCDDCNLYYATGESDTEHGEKLTDEQIASLIIPAAHQFNGADAVINAKEATCTQPGNDIYYKCTRDGGCGKYYVNNNTDPAKNTETTPDEQNEKNPIDPMNHKDALGNSSLEENGGVEAKPASCLTEEDGIKEHLYCTECHNYFELEDTAGEESLGKDEEGVKALDIPWEHDFDHHAADPATCLVDGMYEYWQCKVCDAKFLEADNKTTSKDESDDAADLVESKLGHLFSAKIEPENEASCVEKGMDHYYTCTRPGCTAEPGEGDSDQAKFLGNNADYKYRATGASFEELTNDYDYTNHVDIDYYEAQAETCIADGWEAYNYCSACERYYVAGDITGQGADGDGTADYEKIPTIAAKHILEPVTNKDQNCVDNGYVAHWKCTRSTEDGGCGKLYLSDNATDPGKAYENVQVEGIVIPADGHDFNKENEAGKPATCLENGYNPYWYCETCEKYFNINAADKEAFENALDYDTQVFLKATDHKFADEDVQGENYFAAVTATCANIGNNEYWLCQNSWCDYSNKACAEKTADADQATTYIANLEHDFSGDAHYDKALATCTESGNYEYWQCQREENGCGNGKYKDNSVYTTDKWENGDEVIEPLGHDFEADGSYHKADPAKCTTNGTLEYWTCMNESDDDHTACGNKNYASDKDKYSTTTLDDTTDYAEGHDWDVIKAFNDATCLDSGNKAYWHCQKCKNYYSNAEKMSEEYLMGSEESVTVIDPHGHDFTADPTAHHEYKAAGCLVEGNPEYWLCDRCERAFNELDLKADTDKEIKAADLVIEAHGHDFKSTGAVHAFEAPTCEDKGHRVYWECMNDGVNDCGHKLFEADAAVNAPLTEAKALSDFDIAAQGHIINEDSYNKAVAVGCVNDGYAEYWVCQREDSDTVKGCGGKMFASYDAQTDTPSDAFSSLDDIKIDALNHTFGAAEGQKAVTCVEDGSDPYYRCTTENGCGKLYESNDITQSEDNAKDISYFTIEHQGHQFEIEHAYTAATCVATGNEAYWQCTREDGGCGQLYYAANDDGSAPDAEKTAIENGTKDATEFDIEIDPYNHDGKLEGGNNGWGETCTTDGHEEYWHCEACGAYYATDDMGNADDEASRPASYTSLNDFGVIGKAHIFSEQVSQLDPTCFDDGYEAYYQCTREGEGSCGHKLYLNVGAPDEVGAGFDSVNDDGIRIPATGHQNINPVDEVPATCTEDGVAAHHKCDDCGTLFTDEAGENETTLEDLVIEAKGHNWGEWEVVESPNCTDKGSKKRECIEGDATEYGEVDETGHEWETDEDGNEKFTVDKEPTCTEEGSRSIHCKNCEVTKNFESIPAKGHNWVIDEAVEPTETETGLTEGKHCTECDEKVEQEVVPAHGILVIYGEEDDVDVVTNTIYLLESGDTAVIHCSGPHDRFIKVIIEGYEINPIYYTVEEGSTIITFKPHFLDMFEPGVYSVTLVYTYGSIDTDLTIIGHEAEEPSEVPTEEPTVPMPAPETETTTEPETETTTEPTTEPETETTTEPTTEPETEATTQPATEPETEATTGSATEPEAQKPVTDKKPTSPVTGIEITLPILAAVAIAGGFVIVAGKRRKAEEED